MTSSADVPITAVRKLARSFSQWLQRAGFAPRGRYAPTAVFWKLDHQRIEEHNKARLIRDALHWLVAGALAPARRNVARHRIAKDEDASRKLALGNEAADLARKLRNIIAKLENLEGPVRAVSERQSAIAARMKAPSTVMSLAAFGQFVGTGKLLVWAIDPPPVHGRGVASLPLPRTASEWFEAVVEIEVFMAGAGFKHEEIALLTDRDGPEAVATAIYLRNKRKRPRA
ncbi:MAG TPA: hypothetical protein VJV79_17145 [Polyangiaceae bacterium]|nr:hypothetical protein [Polyangiaceae bacterium]